MRAVNIFLWCTGVGGGVFLAIAFALTVQFVNALLPGDAKVPGRYAWPRWLLPWCWIFGCALLVAFATCQILRSLHPRGTSSDLIVASLAIGVVFAIGVGPMWYRWSDEMALRALGGDR